MLALLLAAAAFNGGRPMVSPDGALIAFESDRLGQTQIFLAGADGQNERPAWKSAVPVQLAGWRGREILFSAAAAAGDGAALSSFDLETQKIVEIARVPGRAPRLSPDGARLTWSAGPYPEAKLMLSAVAGGEPRQLAGGAAPVWYGIWSPDGRIAFPQRGADGRLQIWIIDAEGRPPRQLTHFGAEEGDPQMPAWSPDGKLLAVQSGHLKPPEHSSHLFVVDAATGAARKLQPHSAAYLDETPAWFPDGRRLAFQSDRSGRMEVWTMAADGTEARQVSGRADGAAALAVVQSLLDGWREADAAKVDAALHKEFREVTLHLQPGGEWTFSPFERAKLVAISGRIDKGAWDDRLLDPRVLVDGPIAVVWSRYRFTVRYSENGVAHAPVHCGIETFQLYRIGAEWKIVNFADTHADTCP